MEKIYKINNNLERREVTFRQKIVLILFGMFLTLVILEIVLRLGGLVFYSLQEHRNTQAIKQKGAYRIMCLGESTTALGGKNSYPSQLEKILNGSGIGISFIVINKGAVGVNTSYILAKLEENLDKYSPDLVTVMMGANEESPVVFRYPKTFLQTPGLLLTSLKIYKLARLLKLHMLSRMENKEPKDRNNINDSVEINKPMELDLKNDAMCVTLGQRCRFQGEYIQAKEYFNKALELNPYNDAAYVGLGWCYRDSYEHVQAEELFKKAVELNLRNDEAYLGLGFCYRDFKKFIQSDECFKKAVELSPRNAYAYRGLGNSYRDKGQFIEAINSFKKFIELVPQHDRTYSTLAELYTAIGRNDEAKKYYNKAFKLRSEYYQPSVRFNYLRLKKIVDKRGIKLICIQYPMRSIEPLKKIFLGQEGIIFVDNEKIFKTVVPKRGYWYYFEDNFAGDFGHCTPKGNRLLAENIANVILKGVFHK